MNFSLQVISSGDNYDEKLSNQLPTCSNNWQLFNAKFLTYISQKC